MWLILKALGAEYPYAELLVEQGLELMHSFTHLYTHTHHKIPNIPPENWFIYLIHVFVL